MAEKIEGYITEDEIEQATGIWLFRDRVTNHRATLVIGDERVFTESEVKAMLRTITHCTGSPLVSIHINEVRRVFAEEHGIVLDPA